MDGNWQYRLKVTGWKKDIPCKWKSKESCSSNTHKRQQNILLKTVTRDKDGHYIMIKGSFQEEDIININIYVPNMSAPQYIRQTLTDTKELDSNIVIVEDF